MVCNKPNAKTIARHVRQRRPGWIGKSIALYVATTRDPSGGGTSIRHSRPADRAEGGRTLSEKEGVRRV